MATVPSYGGQQAAPTSQSGGAFSATPVQNESAQQLQQAGDTVQRAGGAAANIATDIQQMANQVRVDDALNKVRQQAQALTYDPQTGYQSLKGDAALTRPDGQSLEQEYGGKLNTSISDIASSLGNDAQRRAFQLQANDLSTQFNGSVQSHKMNEYRDYAMSTQEGTIKLGVDAAKQGWNDPQTVRTSLDSVKAAVYRAGSLQGLAANDIEARIKQTTSAVHESVIQAALQSQNPEYAQQYLAQNKGGMMADDILKVTGLINHDMDGRVALAAVRGAGQSLAPQIAPTNMDRLTNIVQGMESGGNANAVGPNVPGQGTAKGSMQVMDATAKDPGLGVVPAADNTPAERARVGRDYLSALVKKYGDPALALAAYNAGPGTVDKAMTAAKKNGTDWAAEMKSLQSPANFQQTQAYVATGMQKLGSGGGAAPFPTESQFIQSALAQLGPNPRIQQVQLVQSQAATQYGILNKSRQEQGEQAVMQAQQALVSNNGNFAALSPELKAAVQQFAPDKYDNLQDYAGKIADPVRSDNLAAYNEARAHPDELAKMSDATFESFIKQNFTQRTAREMVKFRQDEQDGSSTTGAGSLNRAAVDRTLNERLASLGIPHSVPAKDTAGNERLGGIRAYVDRSILDAQAQAGQKLTADDINKHITKLFSTDVTFKNTMWGMTTGTSAQKLMAMQVPDLPAGAYDTLRKSLVTSGNRAPTDTDVLNLYRRLHAPK